MKRVFIVYTNSDEQVKYENGKMIIPSNESMALEFTNPSDVSKALKLFPQHIQVTR